MNWTQTRHLAMRQWNDVFGKMERSGVFSAQALVRQPNEMAKFVVL
ncbi:hypothetical protein [Rhodoblastus sp.]